MLGMLQAQPKSVDVQILMASLYHAMTWTELASLNKSIMPDLSHASYREVRTRMSQAGLSGSHWHVGHATPDPNKRSLNDREDFGWNLFCQGARDNIRLGHRLVSCSEASHYGAFHVNCSI